MRIGGDRSPSRGVWYCTRVVQFSGESTRRFSPIPTPFADDSVDHKPRGQCLALDGDAAGGDRRAWLQRRSALLDDAESDAVIETARAHVPRDRTLIVGVGRESTAATIAAAKRAGRIGADVVLVRTPSFYKNVMTSDAFVRHYTAVADASPVPVLLYNVSVFTGVNLLPDAAERLAAHANIIGMKESNADLVQLAETIARTPDDFVVLGGSAPTFYHALCAGVDGACWRSRRSCPISASRWSIWFGSSAMPRRSRCSAASRRSDGCWAQCMA